MRLQMTALLRSLTYLFAVMVTERGILLYTTVERAFFYAINVHIFNMLKRLLSTTLAN